MTATSLNKYFWRNIMNFLNLAKAANIYKAPVALLVCADTSKARNRPCQKQLPSFTN